MAENPPGHSFMHSHPLGIIPGPRRPSYHNGPDWSHMWVEEAVAYRIGYFTGQGRALLSRKSVSTYLLILEIFRREKEKILLLHCYN